MTMQRPAAAPSFQYDPLRRKTGRPSALNPETERALLDALRAGSSNADAARYVGITPVTLEKWIRRGEGKEPTRPATPEYVRLARLVDQAKAQVRVLVTGNIVARSRFDIQAALAWMRVHGGPEWTGAPPEADYSIDARDQSVNVIVLTPDQAPDFVKALITGRRATQDIADAKDVTPQPEPKQLTNGNRYTDLDSLRVEADDADRPGQ